MDGLGGKPNSSSTLEQLFSFATLQSRRCSLEEDNERHFDRVNAIQKHEAVRLTAAASNTAHTTRHYAVVLPRLVAAFAPEVQCAQFCGGCSPKS